MSPRGIELFAAIYFFVIGASHLLQPNTWVDFFMRLRDQGRSGMFTEGFQALIFGALVVAFHNIWTGLPTVLTVIGWGQIIKATVRFAVPQVSLRSYQKVAPERAWHFRAGGAFSLMISAFLGWLYFQG